MKRTAAYCGAGTRSRSSQRVARACRWPSRRHRRYERWQRTREQSNQGPSGRRFAVVLAIASDTATGVSKDFRHAVRTAATWAYPLPLIVAIALSARGLLIAFLWTRRLLVVERARAASALAAQAAAESRVSHLELAAAPGRAYHDVRVLRSIRETLTRSAGASMRCCGRTVRDGPHRHRSRSTSGRRTGLIWGRCPGSDSRRTSACCGSRSCPTRTSCSSRPPRGRSGAWLCRSPSCADTE